MKVLLGPRRPYFFQRVAVSLAIISMLGLGFALVAFPFPKASAEGVAGWQAGTQYHYGSVNAYYQNACVIADLTGADYIYCFAGTNAQNTPYYNSISATGFGGSWTSTVGSGQQRLTQCQNYQNYVFCESGLDANAYYAQLTSTGIASWTSTTYFGANIATCTAYAGYMYCIQSSSTTVKSAPLSTSTGIGAWTSQAAFPVTAVNGQEPGCVVPIVSGTPYIVCVGTDGSNTVAYASLAIPGTISSWSTTTVYAGPNEPSTCWAVNAYVYCAGEVGAAPTLNIGYYAQITPSGVSSAGWLAEPDYPVNPVGGGTPGSCQVDPADFYIYCVGTSATNGNTYWSTAEFGQTVTVTTTATVTTTVTTTVTIKAGDGTSTGSGQWLTAVNNVLTPQIFPAQGTIYNITLKVEQVYVTTATVPLYIGIYVSTQPSQVPSAAVPLVLAQTWTVTLTNASGSQLVSIPSAQLGTVICANCYWSLALFSPGTGANSATSGAKGTSGVEIYKTSGALGTWGTFAAAPPPPGLLPNSWYFQATPANSIYAFALFDSTVGAITVAGSTTTVTSQGTATSTSTVTTTISTISAGLFSSATNWPVMFFLLFLPAALFMGATRTLAGGIFGAIIGTVLGLVLHVIQSFIFTGLVISLVCLAVITWDRGGEGG